MKYSLEWLIKELNEGVQPEYFFFWGHTPKRQDLVDKSCFSQWYPAGFTVDGIIYRTAEHWMMVKKALLFNDPESAEKILAAPNPAVAKKLGRELKNFDAALWASHSYEIVVQGNKHKFSQNETLKTVLLQTGNKIIVEASPVDNIWGIGLAHDAKEATNPFEWKGTNLLGFALMEVRSMLKE
jgi:ribA/ribD-fused uncharacterized protein